ncbi:imidazole glycerol phosphate synthase [Elstera litoralis]|uniref:Imidazole glycerol phosphate synthase subunit HisH n=1 Tax=Elstera litoralis TaxID=552518 RepID=A0A0F3ISM6_9PROT|nr:imidazole glycerol phosphate synthase subunit HisH [Elstera litoralis]KJV08589.1 imidazole glycerol phosphate synthase [Elstera litoralis]
MAETIAVIDYGSGNLTSAAKALERAARDAGRSVSVIVTGDADKVATADRLVLPGQGAFGDCRRGLLAVPGLLEALTEAVRVKAKPFFGICVGMQLMVTRGIEHGEHAGLDWIPGICQRLTPTDSALKIPHMGWNTLTLTAPKHPILAGLGTAEHVYFVHSYHITAIAASDVLAETEYGGPVVAILGRDTMVGTQFHAEKSQAAGLRLLGNFLSWRP